MITFDELHAQKHKITELSNVILHLIQERALCDTETACELFFRYVEQVHKHLELHDNQIFAQLLADSDQAANQMAENFLSGSVELKRIFRQYLSKWANTRNRALVIRDHGSFVRETREMFQLVLNRIQDETEKLYPFLRRHAGDQRAAA